MKPNSILGVVIFLAFLAFPTLAAAYTMPTGIPDTAFGVHTPTPERPSNWNSEIAGYYYVNPSSSNASDSNQYGTPNEPRLTLPSPIPAGSYVEMAGTYTSTTGGATRISSAGTESNPVWIVGLEGNEPTFSKITTFQGTYLVIDNVIINNMIMPRYGYLSHHITLRNSDIHYNLTSSGALIGLSGSSSYTNHDLVIFNNDIHDSRSDWDVAGSTDIDAHGIKPHNYAYNLWIIKNRFYNLGGNAIQVGDQTSDQDTIHHIYIGDNEIYNTRQTGIGIKKASDVVITKNVIHDIHEIQTGNSTGGIAYQYAPRRIWIMFNTISNCDFGIKSGSDTSPSEDYIYIVGNVIYDISASGSFSDNGWSPGSAIMINGSNHIEIIGNTIFNAEQGIETALQGASINIENNIISNMTDSTHIHMDYSSSSSLSTVRNNVFHQPGGSPSFRWAGTNHSSLTSFENNSTVSGNVDTDPSFTTYQPNSYSISSTSSAIDIGLKSNQLTTDVYAIFLDLYGLSINSDIIGKTRTQMMSWDIGAYEFTSTNSGSAPPSPPTITLN
jgi:hypothetical protein